MVWAWMLQGAVCSWNTNGIMAWASLYSAKRGVGGLNLNPKPFRAITSDCIIYLGPFLRGGPQTQDYNVQWGLDWVPPFVETPTWVPMVLNPTP